MKLPLAFRISALLLCICLIHQSDALVIPRHLVPILPNKTAPFFSLHRTWTEHGLGTFTRPLIDDIDLDGKSDLFANTLDGSLVGILNFNARRHIVDIGDDESQRRWDRFHYREQYLSSPVSIQLPFMEEKVVVFTSREGLVDVFNASGYRLKTFRIPSIFLDSSWLKSGPSLSSRQIDSYLRWTNQNPDRHWLELKPILLSTPLSIHHHDIILEDRMKISSPGSSDLALLICINYVAEYSVNSTSSQKDVILAGVLGITSCVLSSAPLCACSQLDIHSSLFYFVPLELTKLSAQFPAFLLSTPVLTSVPNIDHSSGIYQFLLVSSGSGFLHKVSLRSLLRHAIGTRMKSNALIELGWPIKMGSITSDCLILDCPSSSAQPCCLIADIGFKLTLIQLDDPVRRRPRKLWSYQMSAGDQDFGNSPVPTVVRAAKSGSYLFVVIPDASGDINLVYLDNGSAVFGSPVKNPFRNNLRRCNTLLSPATAFLDRFLQPFLAFFTPCGQGIALNLQDLSLKPINLPLADEPDIPRPDHSSFELFSPPFPYADFPGESIHSKAFLDFIFTWNGDLIMTSSTLEGKSGDEAILSSSCVTVKPSLTRSGVNHLTLHRGHFILLGNELNLVLSLEVKDCFSSPWNASSAFTTYFIKVVGSPDIAIVTWQEKKCCFKTSLDSCHIEVPLNSVPASMQMLTVTLVSGSGRFLSKVPHHTDAVTILFSLNSPHRSGILFFSYWPILLFLMASLPILFYIYHPVILHGFRR